MKQQKFGYYIDNISNSNTSLNQKIFFLLLFKKLIFGFEKKNYFAFLLFIKKDFHTGYLLLNMK